MTSGERTTSRLSAFGVEGLDHILGGGLAPNRLYLLEGAPGSGKTTLALQFLLEGARQGERGLYVTLSETAEELASVVASHDWPPLDERSGVALFDLSSAEEALRPEHELTLLHPWEVELGETIRLITEQVEKSGAARVVFDSLSEMRLLSQNPLRFRRQVLALKQYFAGRKITLLLLDDLTSAGGTQDLQLHSLAHGVISLHGTSVDYGADRRRVRVVKMRAAPFRAGWHDYEIRRGGLVVFPRLVASEHDARAPELRLPSGNAELDDLLEGGPLRGSSMVITGAPGTGKTTLALQYVCAAAARGERTVIYEFEERLATMVARARSVGMDLESHMRSGRLTLRQIDPAELSPGEFTQLVRDEVDVADPASIVMIDSLNGYLLAMPEEKQLLLQMHELLAYLNQKGVTAVILHPQQNLFGPMQTAVNVSYLADVVLMLRYFEAGGRVRKALSAVKNRGGAHEDTIREFRIDDKGVSIGEALTDFHGVLTGTPTYVGTPAPLLEDREGAEGPARRA